MDPRDIIKRPVVTEHSTDLMANQNKFTFEVDIRANKTEIKRAVEDIFGVKVLNVTTMRVPGKLKRMGRHEGRTPNRKKAIVTLAEGQQIELFEGI
ncbi:MAG: 50S ribosomal protein L23 [Limnochordia bacterium]|jgi:large subunit ribosomal protein L23